MVRFCFYILFFSLRINAQDTTVDTLWGDRKLDGNIFCYYRDSIFNVSQTSFTIFVGCGRDFDDNPLFGRGYLSFTLSQKLRDTTNYELVDATLSIYQLLAMGNDTTNRFPYFHGVSGSISCLLDHIDYGDSLEVKDWIAGDSGKSVTFQSNIGVLSAIRTKGDSIPEYKNLRVFKNVQSDIKNGRKYSQYRIRFPKDYNPTDSLNNGLYFKSSDYVLAKENLPFLLLNWRKITTSVNQSGTSSFLSDMILQSYPNPFNATTKIRFKMNKENFAEIKVYNLLGQYITTIFKGIVQPNFLYLIDFYTKNISSGVYFCVLNSGLGSKAIKLIIEK